MKTRCKNRATGPDGSTITVGYVVSRYPAISHVFIQREIHALRDLGARVDTFSVHRADPATLLSGRDSSDAETTTTILPVSPVTLVATHARACARWPRAYFSTLRYAIAQSPPGMRARVWQVFYFAEAVLLWAACRARGIRHLHAHFANVGADVAWLASHLGAEIEPHAGWRWSFTMHGCVEFWSVDRFNLVRKVAAAEQVFTISEFTRAQLMALCAPEDWRKLSVVHCGVDLERYHPPVAPDGNGSIVRVLVVGRLSHEKGHPVALEAIAELRKQGVDARLTLVGDGPFGPQLRRLARKLGIAHVVTFTGAVGQDEMPAYYREADIFCQPSFAEGIPVVLMEAMASGLPVVSSAIAGIPELVEDGVNGRLVPPGRPDLLAAALGDLARQPQERRAMGAAGRAVIERSFDTASIAREIVGRFGGVDVTPALVGSWDNDEMEDRDEGCDIGSASA